MGKTKPKIMSYRQRARRNAQIVAAYVNGETRVEIAERFKLTPRSISRIVAKAGATMTKDMHARLMAARRARPGFNSGGRPREIHLSPEEMREYGYLRKKINAAFARQVFGIAA